MSARSLAGALGGHIKKEGNQDIMQMIFGSINTLVIIVLTALMYFAYISASTGIIVGILIYIIILTIYTKQHILKTQSYNKTYKSIIIYSWTLGSIYGAAYVIPMAMTERTNFNITTIIGILVVIALVGAINILFSTIYINQIYKLLGGTAPPNNCF
jgi:hypothetical protein